MADTRKYTNMNLLQAISIVCLLLRWVQEDTCQNPHLYKADVSALEAVYHQLCAT